MTVKHVAVVNHSTLASEEECAVWTEAVRIQVRDHFAEAWGMPDVGVFYYGASDSIPADEAAFVGIVDDDGNAEAAGYHSVLGNMVYGLVDLSQSSVPSRTLSHEVLEILGNPHLDNWLEGPRGLQYAREACDACQQWDYEVSFSMFGRSHSATVSDFVLPTWWDEKAWEQSGWAATNYLGGIRRPWEIAPGGYAIARQPGGGVVYLAHADGARMSRSKASIHSRTNRIVRGQ